MNAERRKQALLALLLVVLAAVAYRSWNETSGTPEAASNPARQSGGPRQPSSQPVPALSVHLDALEAERPKPDSVDRDLFRFRTKAAPPPPPSTKPNEGSFGPPAPAGPPQPPPITLKCIGVMKLPGKPDMAILSDGVGPPMFGYVGGPPVAGRYRVLRIGVESVEVSYLDGSGRTTIRVSGQ